MNWRKQDWLDKEASHSSTRYEITKEGEETLNFFLGKNISPAIVEDMDQYLKENKFRLREEVGTTADFYKGTNQDYIVHCEVRENKAVLIRLDLSVPDKDQAGMRCAAPGAPKARRSIPILCIRCCRNINGNFVFRKEPILCLC